MKPAPAAETAQYDRGKSMRSEDPNFQQKQEERCGAQKTGCGACSKRNRCEGITRCIPCINVACTSPMGWPERPTLP